MKDSDAIIGGPNEEYRYVLSRKVEHVGASIEKDGFKLLWVMLNPSTASHTLDDHTIRKCMGYARRWGASSFRVVNLFAYRTKDVKVLAHAARLREQSPAYPDIVGPSNDNYIRDMLKWADQVVCAWGAHEKLPPQHFNRPQAVLEIIKESGTPASLLGLTKSGGPNHPLMQPYDAPRIPWSW